MKRLLFVITFVAISQQQIDRRLLIEFPWISNVGKPLNYPLKTLRGYTAEYLGRLWSNQQMRHRLLVLVKAKKSPIQRVTLTTTSTCTSLTVSTCIPRANFFPRAPAQIINCRRKRHIHPDGSFTIDPSQILKVMPTQVPSSDFYSSEISSSKVEFDAEIADAQQLMRNKRGFFHLWPSNPLLTETTVITTTWSVVSSTFTSTFIPAADFLCLPPGYRVC